ncbi:MAG: glycosyltransferase family 2 protein [Thermoleophilia bacterium]
MSRVDVVVVAYNSRDALRGCVESVCRLPGVHVIVVDNASPEGGLEVVEDLPVEAIANPRNGGFSYGVNTGVRAGDAPYVLLLNPDASIDGESLARLAGALDADPGLGAVAPLIRNTDGSLQPSLRRFPRLRSTFAQALFLQRLRPRATWADEVIRDPAVYAVPGAPEWVSGACVLVRRDVLRRIGGMDEGFFLYGEDKDLCRRIRDVGFGIAFDPDAVCAHEGGASAPRAGLLPVLAASRVRYAHKHYSPPAAALERVGVALSGLTHAAVGRGGPEVRRGHLRAARVALTGSARRPPAPGGPGPGDDGGTG